MPSTGLEYPASFVDGYPFFLDRYATAIQQLIAPFIRELITLCFYLTLNCFHSRIT